MRLVKRPWVTFAVAVAVVLLIGGLTGVFLTRTRPTSASASSGSTAGKKPKFALLTSQPAPGTTNVQPNAPISLSFNSPLAAGEAQPTLSPQVAGAWVQGPGDTLTFEATQSLPPGGTVEVTVPGGSGGVTASDGQHLAQSATVSFSVAGMPMLRTQELLAELGYLPLAFTPTDPTTTPATEMAIAQPGSFTWRWGTLPATLTSIWAEGQPNTITTGAVMAFEDAENLATDGDAGPEVWGALLSAAAAGQTNPFGHYDFVEVSEASPETVTVWQDGAAVYQTLANTGIAAAPTAQGTFPVYARYTSTTMTGHNPDGSFYSDPGVPWVSYFNGGDALHGFDRASYGWPQSLGCVEMPPANAQVVFPLTPIGTLVQVT
jgi:peptidoglycan hydrolase-like protein with peptidoglycan-binding domain